MRNRNEESSGRDAIVVKLVGVFRRFGYEGATLAKIAAATGLGKASLYHHFPGGKEEMAKAVLNHLSQWRENHVLAVLRGTGAPGERLRHMMQSLRRSYDQGKAPCLLSVLSMGESKDTFSPLIQPAFKDLIHAVACVLMEAGFDKKTAEIRAEDAILKIQGSLILSRAIDSNAPFLRVVAELPGDLLRPEPKR